MKEEILKITKDTKRGHEFFMSQLAYCITPSSLKKLIAEELDTFNLVDVRPYEDYIEGHIPFATHVPFNDVADNLDKFHRDKINVLCACSLFCSMAKKAAVILTEKGYPCMEVKGGFLTWKKSDFDVIVTATGDAKTFEE